ncbi:MAG: cupredoxin domain-containing protein [Rhodanobacteraceae bacterium]
MNRITPIAAAMMLLAGSASAADFTVTATAQRTFDPPTLTINVGDTVTFVNGGGFHNVVSAGGAVTTFRCADGCDGAGGNGDPSSDPWTATVEFPTAGDVPYQCEVHAGQGMTGAITVVGATGAPVIELDATKISGSAEEGGSIVVPFSIGNSGDADLTWVADTADTNCATPEAFPWLSLAPTDGTVAVGDPATIVDVTLDATALTEGLYSATVCVGSNDEVDPLIELPVSFTVTTVDVIFDNGFDP